jgi:hypothetical protein
MASRAAGVEMDAKTSSCSNGPSRVSGDLATFITIQVKDLLSFHHPSAILLSTHSRGRPALEGTAADRAYMVWSHDFLCQPFTAEQGVIAR